MSSDTLQSGQSPRPAPFRDGWRGERLRARVVAAACHLLLSALVCGTLAGLILWVAYPGPYLSAAGGGRLLAMIAAVDLCLGPALTFAVFDTRKRSLRMDLSLIAIVQVLALAYGAYALSLGRPVFLTWSVDRFELVSAGEVDPRESAQAPEAFRGLSWQGPKVAAAVLPDSDEARERLQSAVLAGLDLHHLIGYYQSYDTQRSQVLARARPFEALRGFNTPDRIDAALQGAGLSARRDTLSWAPVAGRKRDLVALLDGERGDLLQVVDLSPW